MLQEVSYALANDWMVMYIPRGEVLARPADVHS